MTTTRIEDVNGSENERANENSGNENGTVMINPTLLPGHLMLKPQPHAIRRTEPPSP
jgi:hypothetical protein